MNWSFFWAIGRNWPVNIVCFNSKFSVFALTLFSSTTHVNGRVPERIIAFLFFFIVFKMCALSFKSVCILIQARHFTTLINPQASSQFSIQRSRMKKKSPLLKWYRFFFCPAQNCQALNNSEFFFSFKCHFDWSKWSTTIQWQMKKMSCKIYCDVN